MLLIADSGSTKTDWCAIDEAHIVKRISTQGINPFHQDEVAISSIIRDEFLVHLDRGDISSVFFYGSGCRDEFVLVMRKVLSSIFTAANDIEAHSDMLGAARSVCGRSEGIACILGTGANSCLYDGNRIVANTPPLGYILGDEGSGAVLGRLFVNALFKGRLPASLRDSFISEYGLSLADVIRRVYREPLANRFLASLAPFIHRHIDIPELRTIVIDNFQAFFRNNVVPYGSQNLNVGAVGSIAYHFSAELSEAADNEGFTIGRVIQSPMEGLIEYHTAR